MKRLYARTGGRVLLCALLAGAVLLLCAKWISIAYLTNDDNAIAFALAGYQTGEPYPYALFINCLLGYLVSGLYTLLPTVPWWAAVQLWLLFGSMTAIGACLLRSFQRWGQGPLLPVLLYGMLLLLLFLQPVAELTYTLTAAAAGAAGCALVILAAGEAGNRRRALDILGAAFLLAAFLMREETGFAALCFFALACAYRLLAGPGRKRAMLLLVTVGALCGGAFLFNNTMQTSVNGADFTSYFHYRERFTDYPRDAYEENPELYASVGWDEPLYDLADQWCFLDERVNRDALQTIVEQSSHVNKPTLTGAARECLAMLEGGRPGRYVGAAALGLLFYGLYLLLTNGKCGGLALLAALCSVGGGCLLCLYLCLTGRFLYRSFQAVAIPALTCAAIYIAGLPPAEKRLHRNVSAAVPVCLFCMALLCGAMQLKALRRASPREQMKQMRAVNAYVLAHPDNVYVRDALSANDYDAFTVYPDAKPVNLISWGGCGMRSEAYRRQLAANGVASPYADMLTEARVYLILPYEAPEQRTAYGTLLTYLRATGLAGELAMVDAIGETYAVYKAVTD